MTEHPTRPTAANGSARNRPGLGRPGRCRFSRRRSFHDHENLHCASVRPVWSSQPDRQPVPMRSEQPADYAGAVRRGLRRACCCRATGGRPGRCRFSRRRYWSIARRLVRLRRSRKKVVTEDRRTYGPATHKPLLRRLLTPRWMKFCRAKHRVKSTTYVSN